MNIPFQSQLVPQWSYQLNCEPCLYLHKIWRSRVIIIVMNPFSFHLTKVYCTCG